MICQTCVGRGFMFLHCGIVRFLEFYGAARIPCPDCIGGIASCCDCAGSAQPDQKRLPPPPPYSPGEGFCYRPSSTTIFENPDREPVPYKRFVPFMPTKA